MLQLSPSALKVRFLNSQTLPRWSVVSTVLLVLLLAGCGNGWKFTGDHIDKDNYALKITPAAPIMTVGHTVQLTASSPWGSGADWSVLPASLGTLDQTGKFTAAATPGDGTVVAMFQGDVRYTATAAVQVVAAPDATITTSAAIITINTAATASVPTQTGSSYKWTIQGGTISGGAGTSQIQFTSATLGTVQLSCTVTNAAGDSANSQRSVTVIDVPPAVVYAPSTYTVTRGKPIMPIRPVSTGGAPVTWTISSGLLPGLIFDPGTGQISGTPTTLSSPITYTVTATNSGGSATTAVTIGAVDATPAIAYVPSTFTFSRGTVIQPVVPTSTGGAITLWAIAPALPAGLSFDPATGRISGTPTVLSAGGSYIVTATNTGGSATATLSIRVIDAPPVIAYNPTSQTFVRGTSIGTIVPTNTGGPALSWSISTTLPPGLFFDTTTGIITGTPTQPTQAMSYTVTASNSGGTSNAVVLTYTVADLAPVFSYNPSAYVFMNGTAIMPVMPTMTSGVASTWSIIGTLPSGLSFDPTSGRISGTPTGPSVAQTYTVKATNIYGSSSTGTVTITVLDRVPVIHYSPSVFSLTKGAVFATLVPTNTGGAATSWAISSSLPQGFSFDTTTGDISGTPSQLSSSATYSVTASNTGGTSAPAVLSIAVVDVPPTIGYSPNVFVFTKGQTITPIVPANSGGAATSFTLASPLPSGLSFDSTTGRVSGTPTSLSGPTSYTISATNSGGTSTPLSVTISVVDTLPVIAYPAPSYTFTAGLPIAVLIPANTGGAATDWSIASSLPLGLVFDPTTGQISGTPTGPVASTVYSVTASNTGGKSQPTTLTLNVVSQVTATITASTTTPLFGATINVTPTFTNAVSESVGTAKGGSDISTAPTSGAPIATSAITSTKIFWLHATNAAGASLDASATVTPQTVVVGPISPAAPTRTTGTSTTFTATASGGVTNGLTWSANGGTIDPVSGAWTAPSSVGSVTITATSKDDPTKSSTTIVSVVAAVTSSLTASTTSPLYGATVVLTPTFTNAVTETIGTTVGGSDIANAPVSGSPITTVALTTAKTYSLRTTNAAGDVVDVSVTVTPQTVVVGPVTPATPVRTTGSSTTFSATATHGVTNGIVWSSNGGSIDPTSGIWTAPSAAGTFTITATSKDDSSKSSTTTVTVVLPGISSLTASNNNPLYGATVTLTPTYSNAVSESVGTSKGGNDISAAPASGVAIPTVAITSAKTYWLHTTNAAGDSVDVSATVTPQTVVVNAISPASPTRTTGTSTTFATTSTGGVTNGLTWSASAGSINASTGVWTAPASAGSVVITATSKDDTSKSATTTVNVVLPPIASLAVSTTSPLFGATVGVTPTFSNAVTEGLGLTQGGSELSNAPVSGVTVTSSALTVPTTFWLRATDAAGDSVDTSKLVTPKTVTISAITASSTSISAGLTTSLQATVANAVNTSVNWTGSGAFSPANTGSATNTTWTAPTTAGAYTLTAASAADPTKTSTVVVTVIALPIAGGLTVSNTNPLYGATVSLLPTFSLGTGAVDNGIGVVTTGTSKTSAAIAVPVTFTLTVTNGPGQTATASSPLVTPQTVSVDVPVGANLKSTLTTGYTQAYTATVHGAYNTAVTWSATGGSFSGSTWTAPATAGPYTLTATSVADSTKSNSTVVTVVNPPTISFFGAADPIISLHHATSLTGTYVNGGGTAVVGTTGAGSSDVTAAAVNNVALPTASLTATTTFTLTVYNQAGNSTSASVVVTVVAGSSSPTVPLSGPRYAHTSTLLPDGRVLIAGGQNSSTALNTSQIYDPTVPSFSDAGMMVSARFGHTATLLANNTVLLTGGNTGNATTAQAEIWNGAFASTGALNTAREKHTATLLLNGQVLIVGGLNGSSPVVTAELFNPSTGSFSYTAGNLNTARYSHSATLLANGKVLISGGYNGSIALASAELFDPSTGAFTVVGSMSTARQRHAAVLLSDGTVSMIGGQGATAPLRSAEIFNSTTNTFASTPGMMANARDGLTGTLIASGKVIVAGGINAAGTPVQGTEIFDPTAGTFGLSGLLATARAQHTATLLQSDLILLVGGLAQSGSTASAELLDPQDGLTPIIPNATVTAPLGAVRAQAGLTASVPSQTHVQYVWMITGGTITGGVGTNSVTFTMPASGTATLDVLVTSDRLVPSHSQFIVTPKPVISTFSATKPTVTLGSSTNLNWTVQDATSLSLDQSIGAVNGVSTAVNVGSLGSTTYTLTATNAGGTATATTSILAVPAPIATSLSAAALTVPVGGNTTLTPVFSQGTGSINQSIGGVLSGPAYPTLAISTPTTFTLTVTNAAGDIAQRAVTVGLQAVSVTGITGAPYVSAGHTATYTAIVTGALNTAVTWGANAGTIDGSGHLTAPAVAPFSTTQTPLLLTATPVVSGTAGSLTIQVVPLPSITNFTSNSNSLSFGGATSITPVFTNGTGQIVGLGSVSSGQAVSAGALTVSKTFQLIVTNLAGDSVSQSITVSPGVVSVSTPTTNSGPIVTTGDAVQFSANTIGSSNSAVTWSASGGSFAGNTWTAPSPGTYTITASSVAPTGLSASTTIQVVAAPTISSFTATDLTVALNLSTTLQAVFANGSATVTPGATVPVSGSPFQTSALTTTTQFILSVSNSATIPRTVTRSLTVNVLKGITSTLPTLMFTGRVGHSVTLLSDGTVLIAGGGATTVAERYDSTAQTLTQLTSPMQAARTYHTATLMTDGRVLLAGGSNGTNAQNTAEIFDPIAQTFTTISNQMVQARQHHSGALMPDGRVLLSGGIDASGSALNSAEIFDPIAGTFTAAPSMSSAREFETATVLGNGFTLLAGGDDTISASNAGQSFDGTSYTSYGLVQGRTQHTATLLPTGNVLLTGGTSGYSALQGTEIFGGSSFAASIDLSSPRYGHAANLLADGQVFVTGGTGDGVAAFASSILVDPVALQVYGSANLASARYEPASTILRNGNILIAGGATNPATPFSSAVSSIEIFDPQDSLTPTLPSAVINAPAYAAAGAVGVTASVQAQSNVRYVWTLTNGTITSGLNTASVTFTKASSAPSTLSVLVISDRQIPVQSSVTITTAPIVNSFTATPSTNTAGLPTTLSWSVTGASGLTLSIDNGIGDVTALGGSLTITTPAVSTAYTLTATDSNGTTTKSLTLHSVAMPVASSLAAAVNPIEKGSSTTILPIFANGSASISNGIGSVLNGVAYPTGTLTSSTTFTLTVQNSVGTTATSTLTVNVMPVVVGAVSGPVNVSVGSSSAQYGALVSGAVDQSVTWSTSAGSITAGGVLTAPATAQDIVVAATSVADPTQHSQITVHVVGLPIASGLVAATNPVLYGGSTTITPTFSLGTGVIDQGIGNVSTGVAYTTGTITLAKTFTLTVTSASGATATFPYTVNPQTVVVGAISGPASGKVTQGHTATFTATVTGAVNTALTWSSAGAGSWSSNVWTAPAAVGTYTLTATAVNGATNSISITVVAAPAITAFTAAPVGVNQNQSSTLTATFSGAGTGGNVSGIVTPGNLSLASGGPGVSTGALSVSQTYTLTITNDAGDRATAQTSVQVFLGSFSATTSSLSVPRNLPTATLQPDGNVLVAGGGSASNAADVFNSTALTFSADTSTLVTGRTGQTSTLLPNGLILIVGGSNGNTAIANAELYNPTDGSFTVTGPLHQARQKHSAVLLDSGKVLVVGGASLNSAEIFDPATGLFTNVSAMFAVRASATLSRLPDGRVLVAGGFSGSTRLSSAEIFDPSTNTFSTAGSMLQARALHTATTLPSGQILIAGGTGGTGSGSAELFNPSLMRFASTGNMIQPRQEHVATLLAGGMVLIAGGNNGMTTTAIDQAELFNTTSGTFLRTDFMSTTGTPSTGAAGVLLPSGKVLVTGGTSDGTTTVPGSTLYTPTDGLAAAVADATITAPAYVAQSATGVAAHVTAIANARYIWLVSNGTLVSGQGTGGIVFNMPASGSATLDVLVITDHLVPSHNRAVVVGEPAPVISSFTAAVTPLLYGASTSITPSFLNGLGGSIIGTGVAGSSDVSAAAVSGVAIPVGPFTAPVQYRLTVTNRAGVSVNQTLIVGVQSIIVSAISPANPTVSVGDSRNFTASASQVLNTGLVWSATGGVMNPSTGAWTAPATPGTYTIRATSAADNTTSSVTTATVVALPAIQSFGSSPLSVNFGQTATLIPVFTGAAAAKASIGTGGTGSTQLSSTAVSGVGLASAALTVNTTFTLTVTNAAGAWVTATAQVAVIQPFSSTGALALARLGQTATALPDGTVLVAGGTGAADKAEIYTAGTGTFAYTQPMLASRKGHTATLLPTGQVLLTGGSDGTIALSSAELYDPVAQTFTATSGTMIHPRQNHAAALLPDGRVLIVGGSNSTENQLATAETFDPSTGSFTATSTSMASAREFAVATALNDGRVLISGGFNGVAYLSTGELFSNGAFLSPTLSMGTARSRHTATLLPSGQVLLSGGYDGSNSLATSTLFIPKSSTPGTIDSFTNAGTMSQSRQNATATLLTGGKVLVTGGTNGTVSLSSAELFNPTNTSFSITGSMANARSGVSSALLLDGSVLVAGGTTDGVTRLASAERFSPQDNLTPFQPDGTIVPSMTHAVLGTTGLTATAPSHTGNQYVWFIRNGSITSGQGTSAVTFSMANSGNAILDVLILSDHLVPAHGEVTIAADPLPSLASFTAALNPVPYGGSTSLTAVFSNAPVVTLGTAGYGSANISASVTSSTPISVGPLTSAQSYTLTLPEVVGNQLSSTLIINVQPVFVSAISPAAPSVTAGHTQSFAATVTQAVNTGLVWSATGGTINPATGTWTAPATPGSYTIKATATADGVTFSATTATVVAMPSITSFTASASTINYGQSASLTAVFPGASGTRASMGTTGAGSSQLTSNATSGTAVSTGPLTGSTTFTLTVTNAAGDTVMSSATVTVTQPFTSTGPLALARSGQTTTPLPDGSVLVAGGTAAADKAEIYAAGSGSFSLSATPMQNARKNHTATLLPNGKVLLTGGTDGATALSTAELYDPATGSFTAVTGNMLHARQNHAAALLSSGRVLLIGGSNSTENELASVEVFDPVSETFTALSSSLVQARESARATSLPNGNVLVTGGLDGNGAPLGSAELYSAGAFGTQTFPMRSPRLHHTATLLPSGQVLLSGGFDGFTRLASAEVYTGGSSNSSFLPISGTLATAREQHTATVLVSGKLLLAGGTDGTSPVGSAEIFDPASQTFVPAGTLITARFAAGSTLLETGKVLIAGGTGASSTALASAELFDPQDGQTPNLTGVTVAAPSTAPAGSSQVATITVPSGAFYFASIDNGTLTSGNGAGALNFTPGIAGTTTLYVLVYTESALPVLKTEVIATY